jgi:hypothetical protein
LTFAIIRVILTNFTKPLAKKNQKPETKGGDMKKILLFAVTIGAAASVLLVLKRNKPIKLDYCEKAIAA